MTWIKTLSTKNAEGELREALQAQHALYPSEYNEQVPGLPNDEFGGITASHTLIPQALLHAFATFGAYMSPELPLSRRDHELIATAVSQTNCTFYCSTSHREFLRRVTQDDALIDALKSDPATAPLNDRERLLYDYAVQVTQDATKITKADHDKLEAAGFDDVARLQITGIAAWFNYINRMADALGVGR